VTKAEYIAPADASCRAATDRFDAALADLDLLDLAGVNETTVRFAEAALAELRALPAPEAGRAVLDRELSLREQQIDVMRQAAEAARVGDGKRVEDLRQERIDLTHQC